MPYLNQVIFLWQTFHVIGTGPMKSNFNFAQISDHCNSQCIVVIAKYHCLNFAKFNKFGKFNTST